MSDAAQAAAAQRGGKLVTELKVSGHLMNLDVGLFCIVQAATRSFDARTGLPGVRISLPPGPHARPDAVTISTFRPDGWLDGHGDAALVRVAGAPAQVLVTVYQHEGLPDAAPKLQVLRLVEPVAPNLPPAMAGGQMGALSAPPAAPGQAGQTFDMVAHVQGRGDVGVQLGERLGDVGSGRWIEGFAISPATAIAMADIEYQAVLGRGWLSPWVEGGQFCGSRGMALPVLGLNARLRGAAAETHELTYEASFVDGTTVGPVAGGETCESEGLAAMESVVVYVTPRVAEEKAKAGARAKKPA